MSPFLLCRGVAVPWRCRSGCVSCIVLRGGCVALRLRCALRFGYVACVALCCVAWRLCFVVLRAVALRPRRSCSVSGDCSLPRLAAPCCSVLRRAQNRHFCALFWLRDPHFPAFRAQNRGFCVRMGDFSEIFGLFDTKMGFLCSGSITMAFLQITAHTSKM